jgi:hypothetical protein
MDRFEAEEVQEELPTTLPSGLEGIGKGLGIGGQPLNVGKSLIGNQAQAMAPIVPAAPIGAASMGPLSQMQSLPGVHSNLNNPLQLQGNPGMSMNLPSLDQRASSNMTPSMASNGIMNYGSMSSNANPTGMRVNPSIPGTNSMTASGIQSSGVYEREFRSTSVPSDTVLVRNLPPSLTWQSLRDRFSEVGEVRYAELKGVGVALVRFMSERDAQRAIELMNGSRFEGRIIDVTHYF